MQQRNRHKVFRPASRTKLFVCGSRILIFTSRTYYSKHLAKAKWPSNKTENVQACSSFRMMYIMLSLCRSNNNRRHQHKCLCYYVSDYFNRQTFCLSSSLVTINIRHFRVPSCGVLNYTPLFCTVDCIQEKLLLYSISRTFSLHAWIYTHFHTTQLWHWVRGCSGTYIAVLTAEQELSYTDVTGRFWKVEV